MNKQKIVIEIKDLQKSYGDNHVLNGFNMCLVEGENLVIMGKSGSGKSVMIKCLIGLEEYDSGTIIVMGKDISTLEHEELDELRTEVGFLFQGSALYDSMTVRENLEFPLRRHTKKFGIIKDTTPLVMEALENVGLAHTINLMPEELSGGMKRRINLIAGILHKPKVLFLDEPTVGVDVQSKNAIIDYLKNLNRKGTTIIYTSHHLSEAEDFCTHIAIVDRGEIYAQGTPATLINSTQDARNLEDVFISLTGKALRDDV